MGTKIISNTSHTIPRRSGLLQAQIDDTDNTRNKLSKPTVCPSCSAVFQEGRWQWLISQEDSYQRICPACLRVQINCPAGYLTLNGGFFLAHRKEIMRLVHNYEEYERVEHPLTRIIKVIEEDKTTRVTTTDIHLARGIGRALHHVYHGNLEFHYQAEENLLRIDWVR